MSGTRHKYLQDLQLHRRVTSRPVIVCSSVTFPFIRQRGHPSGTRRLNVIGGFSCREWRASVWYGRLAGAPEPTLEVKPTLTIDKDDSGRVRSPTNDAKYSAGACTRDARWLKIYVSNGSRTR